MKRNVDDAAAMFRSGFNCAQSVLASCGRDRGIDREMALRVASTLGGGVGRQGEVCGALLGAVIVLGLLYSKTDTQDLRPVGNKLTGLLLEEFRRQHGSILCRDLLQMDISTEQGHTAARDAGAFKKTCPTMVTGAAEILEELLVAETKRS